MTQTRTLSHRNILMLALFTLVCLGSNAQYYYGPTPPMQHRPHHSQQDTSDHYLIEPTGYLSLNLGLSFPEGSFSNAFGTAYSGYAQQGTNYHVSFGYPINHSNFGFALMYGDYSNGYDLNTYVNNLSYGNSNYLFQPVYPDFNIYSTHSIMGGFFFTYPVGRFSFDGRFMLGVLLCTLPEQDYATEDAAGNIYQYDLQASNCAGFAFDAGLGVRYLLVKISRRPLCALVNLDYIYSSPYYNTIQNVYETPVLNNPSGTTFQVIPSPTYSGHIPISLLNISIGLGYQIGSK